jgi:putative phosphoribosyl transferase
VKLRDARVGIPSGEDWLTARLCHAPDVIGLAMVLDAGSPSPDAAGAEHLTDTLQTGGYATLELELLTESELERHGDTDFNVPLLANRMLAALEWARHQPDLAELPVSCVACGTASGAAVRAGWKHPEGFAAIVCLAGRPDLAGASPLAALKVPMRIIVRSDDPDLPIVLRAGEELSALHELDITNEDGAALAVEWLDRWRNRVHGDDEDDDPGTVD